MTPRVGPGQASLAERARGAVLGALAGDALGVPVEGMGRDEFPPVTAMRGGGSHGMPAGTFSDDGSMNLVTVESLVEKRGLDEEDLGDRLVRWLFNRHWAARRMSFGFGFTTREAIVKIHAGTPAAKAGLSEESDNGNGSLVRIFPVALLAHAREATPRETVDLAHRASAITHAHPRAKLCCGLACLLARGLLSGKSPRESVELMRSQAQDLYASDPWNSEYRHVQALMERNFQVVERHDVRSSGYCVETLEAAVWCLLREKPLEESVLEAVNLGEDADSVGAVVGALSGMIEGGAAIPEAWRKELARIDEVEALVARFSELLHGAG
ncbi:ADP-ribosylglycohydrolase family protein [bacterium]|nr:ADP-ribosylglycohydrolase family protein [bacterium]